MNPTTALMTNRSTSQVIPAKLPSTLRVALRRVPFELLSFSREIPSVVFNFAYPCLMYVIFVGSGIIDLGDKQVINFDQYFLPGMIATGILLATTQELGLRVTEERESSLLKRLCTTPTTAAAYVGGKLGQVTVIAIIQNLLLMVMATQLFDAQLPADSQAWATYLGIFFSGICCGSALGFALSVTLPTVRSASGVITPILLVLQFFSGVFFPFSQLPTWMQTAADFFPLRWIASGMRAALYPSEMATIEPNGSFDVTKGLLVLAAWTIVSVLVSLKWFRWLPHEQK